MDSIPRRRHETLLGHGSAIEGESAAPSLVRSPRNPDISAAVFEEASAVNFATPLRKPDHSPAVIEVESAVDLATSLFKPDLSAAVLGAQVPFEGARGADDNSVKNFPLELEHSTTEQSNESAVSSVATIEREPAIPGEPDLSAAARLCTELCRVVEPHDVAPLLEGAAKILDAVGLIVWVWDPHGTQLRPALAHGYSDEVLAQLPRVGRDTDNATATAFRSAETRIVHGSDLARGAVVVPLMTPVGCVGVLAVELRHGHERRESVRALATIFAAQLATLVGFAPLGEAVSA
jgi:hypothetical protein